MEKEFLIAFCIAILFCLAKLIEMKFIDKEMKPLKNVIRDAAITFVCSLASLFIFSNLKGSINDFMNVVTDTKTLNTAATEIFTDLPGF